MQYVMVSMSVIDYELLTYALSVDSIVQPCTILFLFFHLPCCLLVKPVSHYACLNVRFVLCLQEDSDTAKYLKRMCLLQQTFYKSLKPTVR